MSTVRMSSYLTNEIIQEFKKSFDKANPALESAPKYGDLIYNTYIGPGIESVKEAADEAFKSIGFNTDHLFKSVNDLSLKASITTSIVNYKTEATTTGETGYQIIKTLKENVDVPVSLTTERLVPVKLDTNRYSSYPHPIVLKIPRHKDKNVEYLCARLEYNLELNAKKDLASKQVAKLLGEFTTLNQALKAWPALSKLVSADKLSKVHTKQERKRKQDLQKEVADRVVVSGDLNKTILAGALIGDKT